MATRRRAKRKSLLGNLTDVERRLRYLEKRPAPSRLSNKVVGTDNIKPFAVSTDIVQPLAIVTEKLADSAVETQKIDDAAVTNSKIAENAVQNLQIAPNAVGTSEIANGAVVTDKINDGAVTNPKLASLSVAEGNLQQNSVSTDKIVNGDVTDIKIDTVSATKVTGQIVNSQIASGVDGAKITDNTISNAKLVNDTITGAKIAAGAISDSELASNAVLEAKIIDGAVTTNKIRALAVTETKMAANSVRGNLHIIAGTVLADQLSTGAVTSTKIFTEAVTNTKIGPLAVTSSKIADLAVTTAKIADLNVTGAKIANNEVTFGKIASADMGRIANAGITTGNYLSKVWAGAGSPIVLVPLVGTGANQLAIGNHTHSGGTVPTHTHSVISAGSYVIGNSGTHPGHSGTNTGVHQHGVSLPNFSTGGPITSTLKLKKEIQDYNFDPKKLLNLKLKKYKYKNEVRHLQDSMHREWMFGYIAEEVQEIGIEEILGYDSEGQVNSLQYGVLATLAIELLKVQQGEIDSLKEEIQRLKEKI